MIKRLFDSYFREDLYGDLHLSSTAVLSSGSADETLYGLPAVLKECIATAVGRDWYGYSDSLGRLSARRALAELENVLVPGANYDESRIAVTLGATSAVSSLADMLSLGAAGRGQRALCAVPNYPPLIASIARRMSVQLVPTTPHSGVTDITPLLEALTPETSVVLLQTVTNPTGTAVPEQQVSELVRRAPRGCVIILDECHECLGPEVARSIERSDARVVRVRSLSKSYSAPGLKIGWISADAELIREFYEYASTTYGGPASVHYLLLEVLARFERWTRQGVDRTDAAHALEFEPAVGVDSPWLDSRYQDYRRQQRRRMERLTSLRDEAFERLALAGFAPIRPSHSVNVAFTPPTADDYVTFRRILQEQDLSLFPGVLTFSLSGRWLRMTTARSPESLRLGLDRLEQREW